MRRHNAISHCARRFGFRRGNGAIPSPRHPEVGDTAGGSGRYGAIPRHTSVTTPCHSTDSHGNRYGGMVPAQPYCGPCPGGARKGFYNYRIFSRIGHPDGAMAQPAVGRNTRLRPGARLCGTDGSPRHRRPPVSRPGHAERLPRSRAGSCAGSEWHPHRDYCICGVAHILPSENGRQAQLAESAHNSSAVGLCCVHRNGAVGCQSRHNGHHADGRADFRPTHRTAQHPVRGSSNNTPIPSL